MSDNEHSTAPLGHSEVPCVEQPPAHAVPEFGQRSQYDAEVPTILRGEQSRYVLDQQPSRSKSVSDSGEFMEQAGSCSGEPGALSSDGKVLTGEPSDEDVDATTCVRPARSAGVASFTIPIPTGPPEAWLRFVASPVEPAWLPIE